jgi:hypothetical protein
MSILIGVTLYIISGIIYAVVIMHKNYDPQRKFLRENPVTGIFVAFMAFCAATIGWPIILIINRVQSLGD